MKIKIDNKYQVTADSMNYILQEKKTSKDKEKDYVVNAGYYGTITNALKAYKKIQIRNSDVTTINELLKFIKEIDKKIELVLKGV